VLTSGLYQWTLTQCQFLFQYTELSAQLDWHIYEAQCKVNAVKSIAELKVLGFMVCPTKVCRQLPAKSQSLRLLSPEAETICLPSGLKFALKIISEQIVSASADKNLKLWDLMGNCLQTFIGHTDMILSVNFSPDGKQIVSAYPLRQRQSVCHLG
jgi:WD40 repeat protein